MKNLLSLVVPAALGLTASAAVIQRRSGSCCFSLGAQGGTKASGPVQIDALGQNHLGSKYPPGQYCVNGGPTVVDSQGRTCFVNPTSHLFQCEGAGATPESSALTLSGSYGLGLKGTEDWWACPSFGAASDGSYIIFFGLSNPGKCEKVTLTAGEFTCTAMGGSGGKAGHDPSFPTSTPVGNIAHPLSAPTSTSTSISTSTSTTTPLSISAPTAMVQVAAITLANQQSPTGSVPSGTSANCPTDLSGRYLPPNLIVPVNSSSPSTAYGTQYTASISATNSATFTFDIPPSAPYTGTCALIFLFPFGNQAQFPYVFSGIEREQLSNGGLDFAILSSPVSESTTFATLPSVQEDYGKKEILPGNGYNIATYNCQSGQKISYKVSAVGDVDLAFFQATGKSPLGLFVVPCA